MTTISKFYLLDAATPNTGTMPSVSPATIQGGTITGNATGASTARDATDVAGTANPDTKSLVTATANTSLQQWGHRRFVSRPLAAHTFAAADGNWTYSFAWQQSNTSHAGSFAIGIYLWRPSTGAQIGTFVATGAGGTGSGNTTETAIANSAGGVGTSIILDGDILVFDFSTTFTQAMATAYTEQFSYNGTTEASATTCASFVTPPAALTLFTGASAFIAPPMRPHLQAVMRAANRCWTRRRSGIVVPRLWTPQAESAC